MRLLALPGISLFRPTVAGVSTLTPLRAVSLLMAVTFVLRLVWGAILPPTNDEAYHYLYTTHLNLSYFDHPPMTMWLAKLGILLCGGWVNPLSLRLAFTMMFAGSTYVMYRYAGRWYGEWAGFYAALFLNLSGYYALAGGFTLPDGPFLFFALLTMWALGEAVVANPGRIVPWVWVGLGFGCALLSKYHGIFLPAGAVLYALVTPGARKMLWSPGPYIAVVIGFAMFSPVLIWNADNGWASFVFQGGRAVGNGFKPLGLLAVFLGPIVYLLPWVWSLTVWQLVKKVRHWGSVQGIDRLAVCSAVVPMVFFTVVGCSRWILLHWPLIGYVALMPMAGAAWARWAAADSAWSRKRIAWMAAAVIVGGSCGVMQARYGVVQFPGKDPMADVSGWASVAEELEARGFTAEPHTFVTTNRWYDSGQLAFALQEKVPVTCYNIGDARGFAFWSKPETWVGWNAMYVTTSDEPFERQILELFFRRVEVAADFPMTRAGTPFRQVRVYRCIEQTRPFPFTYSKEPVVLVP
ncbi:MAG: glycosyltransferase family 39 protein [Planctomycetes bacterium]|nr:glycosyltransferase family 39 protein [Planctomycetota bacterium]